MNVNLPWVGWFIPVPHLSPGILVSGYYCLLSAKAVAEVFHLDGDSGKQAVNILSKKIPIFSPSESFSLFTRVKMCQEL